MVRLLVHLNRFGFSGKPNNLSILSAVSEVTLAEVTAMHLLGNPIFQEGGSI
jgi:hypothetical protein